jgi:hypothetical protein
MLECLTSRYDPAHFDIIISDLTNIVIENPTIYEGVMDKEMYISKLNFLISHYDSVTDWRMCAKLNKMKDGVIG